MLMDSYIRRTDRLQRTQAIHVLNAYAEAMNGGKDKSAPREGTQVPADDLFAMMGAKIVNAE